MNEYKKMINEFPSKANMFLNLLSIPNKYTYQSLSQLEKRMLELYPMVQADIYMQTCVALFLGEVLVRNFKKAKWVTEDCETHWDIHITLPNSQGEKIILYPFRRVQRFFDNPEYGLAVCYQTFQDISKNKINTVGLPKGKWVKFGGYQLRANNNDKLSND